MIFVNADVHLRHPTFVEARKQILQRKSTLVVNLGPSNPPLEMVFDQGKMPFVNLTPSNWWIDDALLWTAMHLKNIVGVRVQRQHSFLVSKPIGQTIPPPRFNMQRSLRVLDNFYLDYEVILERPFRVWAMYFFTLEAVFLPFFQRSPRFCQSFESGASSVLIISHCVPVSMFRSWQA